jgi:long-chain fatty acid transport protein
MGATLIALLPINAMATNGIFPMGNGIVAQGMGGAGIANAGDTISAADNPALAAKVSNSWALGGTLFNPNRSANVGGGYIDSESNYFLIPQVGRIKQLNDKLSVGIVTTAMGGMNTDYPDTLFGTRTGQNLMGVIISPTVAYKASDKVSIGASAMIGYESLETEGPGAGGLPGNAKDSAFGLGLKVGLTADVTPTTTLGFVAQTKVNMKEMDDHCAGMFNAASDCSLDLPAVVGIGISTQLSNKVKFVGDVQRIYWEGVPIFDELFGWKDQTVVKVGMEYQVSDRLALRAGYNHGKSPIPASNTNRAILAPAIVEDHLSIGFSKKMGKGTVSAYYARTLENEQKMNNVAGLPAVKMDQNALGVGYSVNF